MPNFLADPFECLARTNIVKDPCKILFERSDAMAKPTAVVYSKERQGNRYSFGNVSTLREPGKGITLSVRTSPQRSIETPVMTSQDAMHAADCLRAAVANVGGLTCVGKSITELAWDELMKVVDRLMYQEERDDNDVGLAVGMATIIAIMENPYLPNIGSVRERATERWYAENSDGE